MSESKLSNTQCCIRGCKTTVFNRNPGITFYALPSQSELKNKWMAALLDRCNSTAYWNKIKICSKHFENKYFDSSRKLKDNAVPTIFPSPAKLVSSTVQKTRTDKLINRMTQAELINDIKATMKIIKVPSNFSDCVTDDLHCVPDTPVEAQLWLLIKKQDHLITRLTQLVSQNKKHVEILQKTLEENKSSKKEMEESVETYKYIVKCLQEKHATLEEQIEILTAVESR